MLISRRLYRIAWWNLVEIKVERTEIYLSSGWKSSLFLPSTKTYFLSYATGFWFNYSAIIWNKFLPPVAWYQPLTNCFPRWGPGVIYYCIFLVRCNRYSISRYIASQKCISSSANVHLETFKDNFQFIEVFLESISVETHHWHTLVTN